MFLRKREVAAREIVIAVTAWLLLTVTVAGFAVQGPYDAPTAWQEIVRVGE
jgi:hypothetical protein